MNSANGIFAEPHNQSLINKKKQHKKEQAGQPYKKKHICTHFFLVCFTYFKRNFPSVIVIILSTEQKCKFWISLLFFFGHLFKFAAISRNKVCKFVNDVLLFLICVRTITTVQED